MKIPVVCEGCRVSIREFLEQQRDEELAKPFSFDQRMKLEMVLLVKLTILGRDNDEEYLDRFHDSDRQYRLDCLRDLRKCPGIKKSHLWQIRGGEPGVPSLDVGPSVREEELQVEHCEDHSRKVST